MFDAKQFRFSFEIFEHNKFIFTVSDGILWVNTFNVYFIFQNLLYLIYINYNTYKYIYSFKS